jgi:hypothetical protein
MQKTVLGFILITVIAAAQTGGVYHITQTYNLGGDGSWDYVVPDPPNHRVFIARQTRVMVVDEDKGTLLGEVPGIEGAHGTAIAQSSGHGFATSGNDKTVVMFDLKTYQPISRIPSALDTDAFRPRIYAQRRRAFVHRDRREGRHESHRNPAGRQAGIWSLGR